MTHPFHQTKFRWTENLTSRFIQLRKENGNLFTGRKYSAQAGWEHILQQMRREFPTIMADVHYRVLKKKWSNLLQQYKELKNPVHGDKNKSDDVSWPFYGAIDEVLGYVQRNDDDNENENENENENDDDLNPHEFLCLSVTPEEPASPDEDQRLLIDNNSDVDDHHKPPSSISALQRIPNLNEDFSIEIERLPRVPVRRPRLSLNNRVSQISQELRHRDVSEVLVSRLPPATELSIKTIRTSGSSVMPGGGGLRVRSFANNVSNATSSPRHQFLRETLAAEKRRNGNHSVVCNYNTKVDVAEEVDDDDIEEEEEEEEEEEDPDDEDTGRPPPRKMRRSVEPPSFHGHECNVERRLNEFLEYTKKRDEENRLIMTRILSAVERIAEKQ